MALHCFLRTFPGRPYRDASMTLMAERLSFEVVLNQLQEGLGAAQDSHLYGPHISRSDSVSQTRLFSSIYGEADEIETYHSNERQLLRDQA